MPEPLPQSDVRPAERLARFLVQPNWFNPRTGSISPQAFKPRKPQAPSTTFRTSIYRIEGCLPEEIWSIGDVFVTGRRLDGRRVLARADIEAHNIFDEALGIEVTPDPHPRHADIVAWPDPEKILEKAAALAIQAHLGLPARS